LILVRDDEGIIQKYPMKEWLRRHPEFMPKGMNADNTSHELRRGLQKAGWRLELQDDEALLIKPARNGDTSFAEEFLKESSGATPSSEQEELEDAAELTFGLERDLQSALRADLGQLEPGLRAIDGGRERVTDSGRVDITAMDDGGNVVAIELKAGIAQPESVTQVLAYMASLAEAENKPVRGILVAGDFHKRVSAAARAVNNLSLKKYAFKFAFESIKK
jgi:hypothetical protein